MRSPDCRQSLSNARTFASTSRASARSCSAIARETIGRYNSRYIGVDPDAAGDSPDYDASDTAISGAFIGTLNSYLARDLGYQTNMAYRASASEEEGFKWDWNHKAAGRRASR